MTVSDVNLVFHFCCLKSVHIHLLSSMRKVIALVCEISGSYCYLLSYFHLKSEFCVLSVLLCAHAAEPHNMFADRQTHLTKD